jgi:xanthosine utilization system XapX-like protein
MLGLAVVLACHLLRVRPALPVVALVAVLLFTGFLGTSQVPGVAQMADAKTSLEHWRDEQIARNSAAIHQLAALQNGELVAPVQDCPAGAS